ncbi:MULTISPECIES: methylglyoxal synthase [unclassified Lentimicrobium]|uniref:methylglyoxal synthase n=1 Tax=unclassified Lentimicrobium TaxID=2677434 RepID=UPI001551DD24|nr:MULTISPECIES: methylglyoxal synthase [unclassified Lentimicrobium]NPD45983.1 methylglyoxal synthase [Lentimicrobium sp. S6]NPD84250.1 methylglyoxal synthase [Lentimicrobium sp. L6]
MKEKKRIAIVAHDNRKKDLREWVVFNKMELRKHLITCTGTTGRMVQDELNTDVRGHAVEVHRLLSGPLGGDQQLGALIAEGKIDFVIFFWDPMAAQPHDVDVKALLRLTVLYNVVTASNRSTADFVITSPLFHEEYEMKIKDYTEYLNRKI